MLLCPRCADNQVHYGPFLINFFDDILLYISDSYQKFQD